MTQTTNVHEVHTSRAEPYYVRDTEGPGDMPFRLIPTQGGHLRRVTDPASTTFEWYTTYRAGTWWFSSEAAREFAAKARALSAEARVYAKTSERAIALWVVLPERDEDVEAALAEAVADTMGEYPGLVFDYLLMLGRDEAAGAVPGEGYRLVSAEAQAV